MAKITLSVLKADIGSIGGHIQPSQALRAEVERLVAQMGKGLVVDSFVSSTGDDIAILTSHTHGVDNEKIHKFAWDVFSEATKVAKKQGLYGAGQDLLKDSFSGNIRGMGPAVAEMEIDERPGEPFLFFAADKTDPGAYSLPLYLAFADPMYCPGLMLSPKLKEGFAFTIMDVMHTEGDKVITLNAPEDTYDIAALLRDNQRFVVESIRSRTTGDVAVSVSTSRLHNISGKYTGKDDPVMLVRVQNEFPATGEVLATFAIGHYVAGCLRGSHHGALMPVSHNTPTSYFDGPPIVSCHAFCVRDGKFTEAADPFAHPFWNPVRDRIAEKTIELRRQGFSGPAMLHYSELEYGGIVERMERLEGKFKVRGK